MIIGDIRILQTLIKTGEVSYKDFRMLYNPWMGDIFFDTRIKVLYKLGLVNYNRIRRICITDKGEEFLVQNDLYGGVKP